jgi:hypothetical protein
MRSLLRASSSAACCLSGLLFFNLGSQVSRLVAGVHQRVVGPSRAEGERSAVDRPSRAAAPCAGQLAAGRAEQRESEPCVGRQSGTGGRGRRSGMGGRGRRSGTGHGSACGSARARVRGLVRGSVHGSESLHVFFLFKIEPGRLPKLDPVVAPPMSPLLVS